jgi:hypothetical protein
MLYDIVDVIGLVAEKDDWCARIGGYAETQVRSPTAFHVIGAADPDAV